MKNLIIKLMLKLEQFAQRRRLKARGWVVHDGGQSWRHPASNVMGSFKFALQHDNANLDRESLDEMLDAADTETQGSKDAARIIDYCYNRK